MVIKDKDGNYIMINGPIQEEDVTLINIYACNIGAPVDNNIMIVGDLNIPLASMDKIIQTESQYRNFSPNTLNQMELIDKYRTFQNIIQKLQNAHLSQVHIEHSSG